MGLTMDVRIELGARFLYPPEGVLEVVGIDHVAKKAALVKRHGAESDRLPVVRGEDDWVLVGMYDYAGRKVWQEHDLAAITGSFLTWV